MSIDDRFAPEGAVWVCGACGKIAKDRYGIAGPHSRGWDVSCMLNAVLCHEEQVVHPSGIVGWKTIDPAKVPS